MTVTCGAVVLTHMEVFLGRQTAPLVTVVVVGVTEQPVTVIVVEGAQVVVVTVELLWVE